MFYGRENELKQLEALYQQPGFQMPVIYGRRRVGKTRLIQAFCQLKRSIFYVSIEQNDHEALRMFSEVVLNSAPPEQAQFIDQFTSWEQAFKFVGRLARTERLVLVIDEYPYLASGNKSIASTLQQAIDHIFQDSQLYLILCGSSMSFMENQVLDYKSPLYGRRTAQFKIHPLDYYDSCKFVKHWTKVEQLYSYAITGGIPQYLAEISKYRDFKTAVIQAYLTSSGPLFEEPMNLMKQETREPAVYNSIIKAIAEGASRQVDISNYVAEESKKTANYLKALQDLEIIEKEYPLGEENKRRVVYKIKDKMFQFWYRFMPKALPMVEMGLSEAAFERLVEPGFNQYFGLVFEDICSQYLKRLNKQYLLGSLYHEFGSWWGTNPELKIEEEIDIVASNTENALFAECKWKNEPLGLPILETLQRRSHLTQKSKAAEYFLFSKSGFTKDFQQGELGHVTLVHVEDLLADQKT